jgi:HTH-type transcriptional regulator / antitoxin MqsA
VAKTQPKKSQPCPECGGRMTFKAKTEQLEYKGHTTQIRSEGWWCASCGEGILEAEALKASERAFVDLKAKVDGLLSPDEIATIRKRLRLSQRNAGELLGGGPRAFQKYESGQVMVSAAMSNLLRLLAKDPVRVKELLESQGLTTAAPLAVTARAPLPQAAPSSKARRQSIRRE